jgi:uncharacterized protein (TIGR02246 family)
LECRTAPTGLLDELGGLLQVLGGVATGDRVSLHDGATVGLVPTRAEDLEEIRKLLARYCFAIDEKDAVGFAELFTEDGVFDFKLGPPVQGREALRQFVSGIPDDRHHVTANEIIELDGDRATVRAYALVTKESPPVISTMGDYKDVLRRTPSGWRFAHRIFTSH